VAEEGFFWTLWCKRRYQRQTHQQCDWAPLIQTNQRPTSIIPPIFTPDALPAATIPIYPDWGQAPNMLACILKALKVKMKFPHQELTRAGDMQSWIHNH